ncbi:head GIN domain-containing protein [Pseudemcibacter aquimaris]|uniref:head GIN domain-containing protein n=1 Tax=Pseudemcibacter aquimaris TaxID=2857064 RepID=UPI00201298EA|nr:head GIN domain-containing protein [Pseudemcibacter aquimaris]MCC3861351.1 DUF2807 domain-containing protein [Pseudemcibacter aquimaris]WDU58123.1 DUF2807 domain-containing protein [Pseudemcibacter aquimaris]
MSMKYSNILMPAAISMAAIAAPANAEDRKLITDIDDFIEVQLNTSSDVHITIEDEYSIELVGDADAIEKMVLKRRSDALQINSKSSGWFGFGRGNSGSVTVFITMPDLEELEINGSGNVEINDLDNDQIELSINGSGDIFMKGSSNQVTIDINGSGDVELDEITGDDVEIDIHGSGNVDIDGGTCNSMEIDINGSGDVDAKDLICKEVTVDVSGSGNSMVYAVEKLEFDGSGSGSVDVFGRPEEVIDHQAKRNSKIKIRN